MNYYLSLIVNEDLHLTLPQIYTCIEKISSIYYRQKCLQVFWDRRKKSCLDLHYSSLKNMTVE